MISSSGCFGSLPKTIFGLTDFFKFVDSINASIQQLEHITASQIKNNEPRVIAIQIKQILNQENYNQDHPNLVIAVATRYFVSL